jgi:alpha-L-arabinofuranosidase
MNILLNCSQGPPTSTWGAKRASLGYTNPFTINFLEIGNEDFLNGGIPTYIGMLPSGFTCEL